MLILILLFLIGAAFVFVPVAWGAVLLQVADRLFMRREPLEQIPRGRAFLWGYLMGFAAIGAGIPGVLLLMTLEEQGMNSPVSIGIALLAAAGTVHAAVAGVLWNALRRDAEPLRAAVVAAGAAAVWLAGLALGYAALLWGFRSL
ncbi:hypothetical protein [Alienimonas californiensis]|uniref:Uncharacterized protein n=1 Tax=Alienimonas californiensis TaxID=2527989 RepID=A0A517P6G1_9PLAN|nr:hypothetical protein [Alienimonas californiensis]QDT14968.1 hypothetical protein CA12_10480 [Alienimonas californiensis]